jgi:hypothetical protein
MARTCGHHHNIIYEIYNEKLAVSWIIKPYAEAVAGAIRAIDPDNLIIVGTPNWSQMRMKSPLTQLHAIQTLPTRSIFTQALTSNGARQSASRTQEKHHPICH